MEAGNDLALPDSFRRDYRYPPELEVDYGFIKGCFREMIAYHERRSRKAELL